MERYRLLSLLFGLVLAVIAVLWMVDRAQDQIRTRDIAAAQAKIDLFNHGSQYGSKTLLYVNRRAHPVADTLPVEEKERQRVYDSTLQVEQKALQFVFDSLIWERERIKTDTLKMPVKP